MRFRKVILPVLCGVLAGMSAAHADISPQRLRAFDLSSSPLMQGFQIERQVSAHDRRVEDGLGNETASFQMRAYWGADELQYDVFVFPNVTAMQQWIWNYCRMRQAAPHLPRFWPAATAAVQTEPSVLGHPPNGELIAVNPILITISGYKHTEMFRRNPQFARRTPSSRIFNARMHQIQAALIHQALLFRRTTQ